MFKIIFIVPRRIFRPSSATIRCRSDPECKVIPYESRRQSQLVMKSPLSNRHFLPVPMDKKMLRRAFSASPERSVSAIGGLKPVYFLIKCYAAPFGIEPVCSRSGLGARRT